MHPLRFYLENVLYKFIIKENNDKNIKILFIGYDPSQNGENEIIFKKKYIHYDVVEPYEKKPSNFWGTNFINSTVEKLSEVSKIKYDFVFSIGVLGSYNWNSKTIDSYLNSIKKLLDTNGRMILHSPIHRFKGFKYDWNEDSMPIEIFKENLERIFSNDNNYIQKYFDYLGNDNKKIENLKEFRNSFVDPEDYQDYKNVIYTDSNYFKKKINNTFKIFILETNN